MVARTTVKINKVVNLGKLSATNNIGGIIGKTLEKALRFMTQLISVRSKVSQEIKNTEWAV